MSVTLQKEGLRTYVIGDTYPIKDKLKEQGCHWDRDKKQWWIGSGKVSAIEKLINNPPASTEVKPEDPDDIKVIGKALYKGKHYYIRWKGYSEKHNGFRCHLTTLDGKLNFYADVGEADDMAKIVKTYSSQVDRRGYETFMTLGKIQRFIEQQKNPNTSRGECTECGEWGPSGQTCKGCHEGHHL